MTSREKELQFQKLNNEYKKRVKEIIHKKECVSLARMDAFRVADDVYAAKRKEVMDKLSDLRRKKAEVFKGDPEKERLFALIRQEEDRLAILKDEWAGQRYKAHREAFNMYTKLDQERRDLDLWIGEEKLKIEVRFQKELETKEEKKNNI